MRRMTRAGVTPSLRQADTLCASRIKKRLKGMRGHSSAPAKKLHSKSRQAYSTSCAPMPAVEPEASPSPAWMALCGRWRRRPCADLVSDEKRQFVLQTLFLMTQSFVDQYDSGRLEPRSHQGPARLRPSPSNQRTSKPSRLQIAMMASRVSGISRLPHSSAARSMSGKLLWRVSCQTRISNCAN